MLKHKIYLKKNRERSVLNFHPWIFSGAIQNIPKEIVEGNLMEVYDSNNIFLCQAFYHDGSITGRVLSYSDNTINNDFFTEAIREALQVRKTARLTDNPLTNAYRLIHAEGDKLPGLIIDNYNGNFVIQEHHNGWEQFRPLIISSLQSIFGKSLKTIYLKYLDYQKTAQEENGMLLFGDSEEDVILENGIQFKVNWVKGQKTGFFLDQRENRMLLKQLSSGKNILNLFCYTGGFSAYAAAGNATSVTGVDISGDAIELAGENMQLNHFENNYTGIKANVTEFLKSIEPDYDIMIVDPPAYAKSKSHLKNAINGYRRLNQAAISNIKPGGVIFTFSCSQVVDHLTFGKIIYEAASASKRSVRIIHRLSQPPDHPVNIFHPEGSYLKGLVLQVF